MLCAFRENYLDSILECTRATLHERFTRFQPIYTVIEEYVIAKGLGREDTFLAISNEPTDSVRIFKIYGNYIFFHANALANKLAEITPYIRLNTIVREKEFTIGIDNFTMIYMYNIDPNFAKIIEPCMSKGSIPIIPPEVELVDIYRRFYSPNMRKTWDSLRKYESSIWALFNQTRNSILKCSETCTSDCRGPSEEAESSATNGGESSEASHGGAIATVTNEIVAAWLKEIGDYVIVDNFALTCMSASKCPFIGAIHVVVPNPPMVIAALKKRLAEFIGGIPVVVKKYELNLPTDYRIRKYVISIQISGATHHIANLFNSAMYELVPYTVIGDYRIGTLAVLLRFLFIDLWFVRILHFFDLMTAGNYKKNVSALFEHITHIHSLWAYESISAPPSYIGVYIDENIAKKSQQAVIFPYYPAKYKAEHGKYRKIGHLDK